MSHATDPVAVSAPAESATGPGALLQQRRIERKLSIEDAARKLRLAPKQLRAIEQDDYERLPGPTYVRGYLRSYAKFLGLSVETILESYNRQPAAAKAVDLTKHAPAPQMSSDHHVIKITTLILAGLVLGLATVWWQGRDDSPIRLRKPPGPATAEVVAPDAPLPETAAAPAEVPAVSESKPRPEPDFTLSPTMAAMPAGPRPLVLHFSQDSWADVRDGAQNKLLYTIISAGKVIRLGGAPPFSVYLGNASGVRVEYNGRPVDISRYQRGPVARLTLGNGAESATP